MQITDVRYLALQYPLTTPLKLAWGWMTHRNFALVLIETDAGLTGIGETSVNFPQWSIKERKITIEEGLRPLLIGENPLEIERLWQKLYDALSRLGLLWGKGAIMSAIGGIDIALWDLAGKAYGLPLYALLGGRVAERIPLYATGFDLKTPQRYVDQGYRALKMRVGFDVKQDLMNVEAVRKAIGDDIALLVDVNMGWSRQQALALAPHYEAFDLYWLEEPVRSDDLDGYRLLKARTSIPLAAGENAFDRADSQTLLETGALSYLMPDPTRAGGLSEVKRICSLSWNYSIPYSPHHYGSDVGFAAALHLMASTPNGDYLLRDVTEVPLREDILKTPIRIEDGFACLSDAPGLGIELNPQAVEAYQIA
ncbi:MAG: mandelate racemase/muconate lactonizing enzyme family protein [Aggregatilineales bacterium]